MQEPSGRIYSESVSRCATNTPVLKIILLIIITISLTETE